jgi:hypothetical protein
MMSTTDIQRWHWREIEAAGTVLGGGPPVLAGDGERVAIAASPAQGRAVAVVLVDADGHARPPIEIGLATVTGAAWNGPQLWLAGAGAGTAKRAGEPMAVTLDVDSGKAKAVALPADGPVVAGPVVVAEPPRAVWASGEPPVVHVQRLRGDDRPRADHRPTEPLTAVQAVADGPAVNVLCESAAGARLVRFAGGSPRPVLRAPAESVLIPGAILSTRSGRQLELWDVPAGGRRVIDLIGPDQPLLQAERPVATARPATLLWSTRAPDIGAEGDESSSIMRGWIASVGSGWSLGPAIELPLVPVAAEGVGRSVVVTDGSSLWRGAK